ncbi:hypothetical protein BC940DRAFT_306937 [Gongronella butleri]|nr:hypothetical protein BC940DRAFT_306937 [Gongronella butleri]
MQNEWVVSSSGNVSMPFFPAPALPRHALGCSLTRRRQAILPCMCDTCCKTSFSSIACHPQTSRGPKPRSSKSARREASNEPSFAAESADFGEMDAHGQNSRK